ncbi:unnamed protein product, partial [Discosporangium mesarthrocarpum]
HRKLFCQERSRSVAARKKRLLTGEAWENRIDGISKLPFWYNRDTGEAIWDKPLVVLGRELYARALERLYGGMPLPLLVRVLSFLTFQHDRMAASMVSSLWSEGANHDTFKKKVPHDQLEDGSFATLKKALEDSGPGDTIELGPGHHWEVRGDLLVDKVVKVVGDTRDPSRVVLELTGEVRWSATRGVIQGVTLRRPKPCPNSGPLVEVIRNGKLEMSACHLSNKNAGPRAPTLSVIGDRSLLFLDRCHCEGAPGSGVRALQGGIIAIGACEIKGSGQAGVEIGPGAEAVVNDSYIFWNTGAGVVAAGGGAVSLVHNDCSHNALG